MDNRNVAKRFPRGFLLAADPLVGAPEGFVPGPLLPGFYVHPQAAIGHAVDPQGRFVIIIGTCVPTLEYRNVNAAEELLSDLESGEDHFLRSLRDYAGPELAHSVSA